MKHTFRFKLGIFLLVINMPFGLGGAALCGWLAIRTGQTGFFSALAAGIYGSSWIMFLAGIWLAGRQGIDYSRQLMRRMLGRKPLPPVPEVEPSNTP